MTSYDPNSIDKHILGFCTEFNDFSTASNIVSRDMFTREMRDVFDAISFSHTEVQVKT